MIWTAGAAMRLCVTSGCAEKSITLSAITRLPLQAMSEGVVSMSCRLVVFRQYIVGVNQSPVDFAGAALSGLAGRCPGLGDDQPQRGAHLIDHFVALATGSLGLQSVERHAESVPSRIAASAVATSTSTRPRPRWWKLRQFVGCCWREAFTTSGS